MSAALQLTTLSSRDAHTLEARLGAAMRQATQDHGLDDMILADQAGLLIASARAGDHDELIAALAPLVHDQSLPVQRLPQAPTAVLRFLAGGALLFLATQGSESRADQAFFQAAVQITRILTERRDG